MSTKKLIDVSYEPEADILTWQAGKDTITHAEEFGNFIVHFGKNSKPVVVELLEASTFIRSAKSLVSDKIRSKTAPASL